jgi:hypothetical protein
MIYGWQDRLMLRIDSWSFRPIREADIGDAGTSRRQWYSDPIGLRLSGTIGLGTEFVILAVCLFFSDLQMYFIFNLCVFNCIWLMTILYRRLFLSQRIIVKMRN